MDGAPDQRGRPETTGNLELFKSSCYVGIVAPRPSRKNKSAARVGHPDFAGSGERPIG